MLIREGRREDCPSLGEIVVAATRSAFEGRVPEQCLLELPVAESVANWRRMFDSGALAARNEIFLVAETSSHIVVGLILAGRFTADVIQDASVAATYRREITVLQVAPDWHRQGVGRRLVKAAADWLTTSGRDRSVAVRVLEPNPNRAFYVRLGARELVRQPYDWAGFPTHDVVYGWQDIGVVDGVA